MPMGCLAERPIFIIYMQFGNFNKRYKYFVEY